MERGGYWLAGTHASVRYNVKLVDCYIGRIDNERYSWYYALRPVVYLPKEVTLTPDSETANLWNINY